MIYERLILMRDLLHDEGSIYVHCDYRVSSYMQQVVSEVFGVDNVRNELIWKRRVGASGAVHESNRFGIITDTILFAARSEATPLNVQYNRDSAEYKGYVESRFTYVDEQGRHYQPTSLVNPGHRPNLIYDYKGYKSPPGGWMISRDKMEKWDREGRLHFPENKDGRIRRKSFADELKGMLSVIKIINSAPVRIIDRISLTQCCHMSTGVFIVQGLVRR